MIFQQKHLGDILAVTVSDTGISHRLANKQNQDAVACEIDGEDFLLAVSDGVGSCDCAELGSKMAVQAAVNAFKEIKKGQLPCNKNQIVTFVISNWFVLLGNVAPDRCCSTLKIAIKIGDSILLISIGDGLLAIYSDGISLIAPIEETAFANHTTCLNADVREEDFWIGQFQLDLHVPYVVFSCTDGVSNNIQAGCEMQLLKEIEDNTNFENLKEELETFITKIADYSSDDRTVGVIKYEWKNEKSYR